VRSVVGPRVAGSGVCGAEGAVGAGGRVVLGVGKGCSRFGRRGCSRFVLVSAAREQAKTER